MAAAFRKWKRETEEHGGGPSEPSPTGVRDSSPVAPSAERKWKRETEEHGEGPSEPSPTGVRDSSPVAPSAERKWKRETEEHGEGPSEPSPTGVRDSSPVAPSAERKWKRETEEHGEGPSEPSPTGVRDSSPVAPSAERKWKRETEEHGEGPSEPSPTGVRDSSPVAPSAERKWKRETEEHGEGPSEPSPTGVRDSSPVAPSAENDEVTDEPVLCQETCDKYVDEVKATFKDDAESYEKFSKLMQDVHEQGENVVHAGVVSRIKELFRGHTSLILGFNMFLPKDHRITLPSTEPPEVLMKQQGIMFKRKVEALGKSKFKEFCEILASYKKHSNSIDYVYKLAETLFADHNDILADFRTFLPTLEVSNSEMPAQEPDQQPALAPRRVKFVHLSANVRDNEAPGESSGRAEISRKGKERLESTNSKEVAGKLKERTSSNREEEARIKPTQVRQPARMSARNASRRQQVQTVPRNARRNAAAAGSPRPASDQRVSARTAARRQLPLPSEDPNTPRAPPPPLPSITAELQERLKNVTKCRPDCKACEHVEYPIFDWQAEDPEYYAKGKANRERERQALIARGVPGSFNDS